MQSVHAAEPSRLLGQIVPVKIVDARALSLEGTVVIEAPPTAQHGIVA
jgi:hypothetical protein